MQPCSVLVESTLHKEDVLSGGHTSVWGSWYDKDAKQWGYACCKGLNKDSACPLHSSRASLSVTKAPQVTASSDDWGSTPDELLPRQIVEELSTRAGAFVEHVVNFAVGSWRRLVQGGTSSSGVAEGQSEGPESAAAASALEQFKSLQRLQEAEAALKPLMRQLQDNKVPSSIVQKLDRIADFISEREYVQANTAYMTLTLGNKRWHHHQTLMGGSFSATRSPAGYEAYREHQEQRLAYETDPEVERYLHCVKRLILLMRCLYPNVDISKNLDI
eukprot:CAMPEP_0117538964 /NCGR_PEP_ID=MMETSP0784-20121206/42746_1 /TAXON_ID=39447 /ORGANISM="" /LENGTH=273 /DNA_ID=CAMNT_0005335587 /DNA_START=52 /DNA_END=873 /DNA_ORIENTATION=-